MKQVLKLTKFHISITFLKENISNTSEMRIKFLIAMALGLKILICQAQDKDNWDKLNWLTGTWLGEGNGKPGKGGGTFSFSFDLNKNILVRKSHSEYKSNKKDSRITHEDLMVIYPESGEKLMKALYFDNEGHIIEYTVSYSGKSVIFLSEKQANAPIFRLIYTPLDTCIVNTKFEISADGINFNTYIEGISKRSN
jgi:hypothetical protein